MDKLVALVKRYPKISVFVGVMVLLAVAHGMWNYEWASPFFG